MKRYAHLIGFVWLIFTTQFATAVITQFGPLSAAPHAALLLFSIFQLLGAPIQGYVSDNYHRKITLISAFACMSVTLYLMGQFQYSAIFVTTSAIIIGFWGNGDVVSKAALLDEFDSKHYKFVFGISYGVLGLPWIIVAKIRQIDPSGGNTFLFSSLLALVGLVIASVIRNKEDSKVRERDHEKRDSFRKMLSSFSLIQFIFVLLIIECGFQLVYLSQNSFLKNLPSVSELNTKIAASGFLIGSVVQMIIPRSDYWNIKLGIIISFGSLALGITISLMLKDLDFLNKYIIYGVFSMGSGIYLPRYFTYQTKRYPKHSHGTILGILESVMVAAEGIISFVLIGKIELLTAQFVACILYILGYVVISLRRQQHGQSY